MHWCFSSFNFFQLFKNVKTILQSQGMQRHVGRVWLTPAIDHYISDLEVLFYLLLPHLRLWRFPLLEFCWQHLVLLQSIWWGVGSPSSFIQDWLYPQSGTLLVDNWSDGIDGPLNAKCIFNFVESWQNFIFKKSFSDGNVLELLRSVKISAWSKVKKCKEI